ncbi:PGAP1-like protein-domain-containing protein [Scheffersomyces amazonensis]|uniref:PGAP1-like protein-domain-containing protein n=1 Tax=Scheffersomyces amazonensis TaxID=1078765 RepID=UPI00315D3F62
MYPSYARIKAFDESHTKFASKYSLYLYREQGKDPIPDSENGYSKLDGIPVLFIPGNAGSYRQVRSIASQSSDIYFQQLIHQHNSNYKNLDFFTADFNEDFTAFHGRTILDQAEYLNEAIKFILELYSNNENPPTSVIIIGHSMGGIVSRVMITLPNYVNKSINTIITLSSPHAAAPLTFDGDILKIYSAIDRFWYAGFHNSTISHYSNIAKERLHDVSLISITGGNLDATLPADYTTLGFLVPSTNGFTVFTTGIPQVWTPIDHLAIVWCAQLRQKLARLLLEIVDYNKPSKTKNLEDRMNIFKQYLLTGFESNINNNNKYEESNLNLKLKLDSSLISREKKIRINKDSPPRKYYAFHLNKNEEEQFSLISSMSPTQSWKDISDEDEGFWSMLLCNNLEENDDDSDLIDYTTDKTTEYVALKCRDASTYYDGLIPQSHNSTNSLMDSSFGGNKLPFHGIKINPSILSENDVVLLITSTKFKNDDDFLLAELSDLNSSQFELGKDLSTLFKRGGADITLPLTKPLVCNIKIPSAWSSLLEYKLFIKNKINNNNNNQRGEFNTFIRQWIESPYESKWHINIKNNQPLSINLHGIAPYVPFKINKNYGLNLEIWSLPTNNDDSPMDIEIKIDLIKSLRLLVLRYRLAIVSICVSIILMVMLIQFNIFLTTNKFPNFLAVLTYINTGKRIMGIILILIILNPLVKIEFIKKFLNIIDPVVIQDVNEINISLDNEFKLNSFFLGLEENSLWYLSILFYLIGNSLVILTYTILIQIGKLIRIISKGITTSIGKIPHNRNHSHTQNHNINSNTNSNSYQSFNRRLIVSIVLLLLIPIYIPYQLVYVIGVVVQLINYLKSCQTSSNNLQRYQLSLLILMLWILPINIPIVIVFVHNISINWKTPFSSHHNILSILPILLLVERNSQLKRLSITSYTSNPIFKRIGLSLIGYFISYCLIYGSCHTFWLHHLFNILSCWLSILVISIDEDDESQSDEYTTKSDQSTGKSN